MQIYYEEPSSIKNVLKKYINKENIFFVFPTSIALNNWAEWCLINNDVTGTFALALEQFIAWDFFKENYASSREEGLHAIPAILKKIFVHNLIQENKESAKNGNPIFKSIINPMYSSEADSFADWITKNLSELKFFYDKLLASGKKIDDEDSDYIELYKRYKDFLGNTMFEPAWISPNFTEKQKTFIIFYPELLDDFDEYESVFSNAENIIVYTLPKNFNKELSVHKFSNARHEIRKVCLYIRNLLVNKKESVENIALHIPDLENHIPYIKRELTNYCIPFVIRSGERLTINNAANIFEQINNCIKENFSYDSIRSLLLNGYLPWKNKTLNENLVREGKNLKCICNYNDDDIWIKNLGSTGINELELRFYTSLKESIKKIYYAKTFKNLKSAWLIFKNDFLIDDEFSTKANNILGRCISLLDDIINIEEEYILSKNLKVPSPFRFFLNELQGSTYRSQEKIDGLSVFDYKVATLSPYKYNIVINCSQSAITVEHKKLSFFTNYKRNQLGIFDKESKTKSFAFLYSSSLVKDGTTFFSYSEDSFSGFAIPHSIFEKIIPSSELDFLENDDFFKNEKDCFLHNNDTPLLLSENQKNQFYRWKFFNTQIKEEENNIANENIQKKIQYALKENRKSQNLTITQNDLSYFFPCKRKWLFSKILNIQEDALTVELLDRYAIGKIHHKILELFFKENKVLPCTSEDGKFLEEEKIQKLVEEKVILAINEYKDFNNQALVKNILESQKEKFSETIMNFLHEFCNKEKFGNCTVLETERWHSFKEKDFSYGGIIDCVLSLDEDSERISIVDFKNTALPKLNECIIQDDDTLQNFQCPMYIHLWNSQYPKKNATAMIFISIKSPEKDLVPMNDFKTNGRKRSISSEEYKKTLEVFKKYCSVFKDEIEKNNFTPYSLFRNSEDEEVSFSQKIQSVRTYKDCIFCEFKTICRTTYTVGSKELLSLSVSSEYKKSSK